MQRDTRRQAFREILSKQVCYEPASVFDPLSARIAEEVGYEVAMMAGSTASLTVLGAPDITLLTATEFCAQAHRVCRAMKLPLLVDADHGYGNALNVGRTIEELTMAGVAAATIEDTLLPAPFGAKGNDQLVSIEEGVGKIRAAIAGRPDRDFVIVARTSAPNITNIDDTIRRLTSYEKAGADALFISGMKTLEQLKTVASATTSPLILGTSSQELMAADLVPIRVRIRLQGHAPIMAAIQAVYETMISLRQAKPADSIRNLVQPELLDKLTRRTAYRDAAETLLN
jgi:carboxyvinyl-carboxyphosphonate phosphorylmutase